MLEVLLGIKSNVDDKPPSSENEDVPIIFEQFPDFKTLQITLNTKHLKMLVYEMLTNKCKESFNSQSTEEI